MSSEKIKTYKKKAKQMVICTNKIFTGFSGLYDLIKCLNFYVIETINPSVVVWATSTSWLLHILLQWALR